MAATTSVAQNKVGYDTICPLCCSEDVSSGELRSADGAGKKKKKKKSCKLGDDNAVVLPSTQIHALAASFVPGANSKKLKAAAGEGNAPRNLPK